GKRADIESDDGRLTHAVHIVRLPKGLDPFRRLRTRKRSLLGESAGSRRGSATSVAAGSRRRRLASGCGHKERRSGEGGASSARLPQHKRHSTERSERSDASEVDTQPSHAAVMPWPAKTAMAAPMARKTPNGIGVLRFALWATIKPIPMIEAVRK